jgi:hypothetical protein
MLHVVDDGDPQGIEPCGHLGQDLLDECATRNRRAQELVGVERQGRLEPVHPRKLRQCADNRPLKQRGASLLGMRTRTPLARNASAGAPARAG